MRKKEKEKKKGKKICDTLGKQRFNNSRKLFKLNS